MKSEFMALPRQTIRPAFLDSDRAGRPNTTRLPVDTYSVTRLHRASSNQPQLMRRSHFPNKIQPSSNFTNAFTTIQPSPLIQDRLEANIKTATIRVRYIGVPRLVRRAFQHAVNIWQTVISSRVPIKIDFRWQALNPSILGTSTPMAYAKNFPRLPVKNTWYPIALANKLSGKDLDPKHPDAIVTLNRKQSWYLRTDGNTSEDKFDLVTIAMHEIYHSLTASGLMNYDAATGKGSWGFGSGTPGLYDRFTINGAGQRLLDTKRFPNSSKALGKQLVSNNLFYRSTNARNANDGDWPKLFAPRRWSFGSSYVHLDEKLYSPGNPNSLITPAFNQAEAIHDPGPIAMAILKDMGWIPPSLNLGQRGLASGHITWADLSNPGFRSIDFRTL